MITQYIDAHACDLAAKLPPTVRRLINQASMDLYHGPHHEDGYPGFASACDLIREALETIEDVYMDEDGNTWDREPRAWEEDGETFEPPPYCLIEARDLIARIVGPELARYL